MRVAARNRRWTDEGWGTTRSWWEWRLTMCTKRRENDVQDSSGCQAEQDGTMDPFLCSDEELEAAPSARTCSPGETSHYFAGVDRASWLCKVSSTDMATARFVLKHLQDTEVCKKPEPDYMKYHDALAQPKTFLNELMRMIAIGWLVEVQMEYRLQEETLFLAVGYLDRFLSVDHVKNGPLPAHLLQLVCIACMFLAAKYEEIMYPCVADFVRMTDNCFTRQQLLQMESRVLNSLQFSMNAPTAHAFLTPLLRVSKANNTAKQLACFIAELTLLDYDMIKYRPSVLASAAVLLASHLCKCTPWTCELQYLTGYAPECLKDCTEDLNELFCRARRCGKRNGANQDPLGRAAAAFGVADPFSSVKEKYRGADRCGVSAICPREELPDGLFAPLKEDKVLTPKSVLSVSLAHRATRGTYEDDLPPFSSRKRLWGGD